MRRVTVSRLRGRLILRIEVHEVSDQNQDDEPWCQSTEEKPNEDYEPDRIEVQADYHPDRWSGE